MPDTMTTDSADEVRESLSAVDEWLSENVDSADAPTFDRALKRRVELGHQLAELETSSSSEDDEGADEEVGLDSAPPDESPPIPRKEPVDKAEIQSASARLREFDPADAPALDASIAEMGDDSVFDVGVVRRLQEIVDSSEQDEEGNPKFGSAEVVEARRRLDLIGQRAELGFRLAQMSERGEFATRFSTQLAEEVQAGDTEMRFLSDELDRSGLSARERARKEGEYLELARRIPRIRDELKLRSAEARAQAEFEFRVDEAARASITDEKQLALRRARGELSAEEIMAGVQPQPKSSPAKGEQLKWESEQALDEEEVVRRAKKLRASMSTERLRKRALAFQASLAANAGVLYRSDTYDPRVSVR